MSVRSLTLRAGSLTAVALLAGLPFAGVASAAPAADRDCRDFPTREAAQAVLLADPTDPNGLDRDRNGIACEDTQYGPAAPATPAPSGDQVSAVPSGSVDAGDGSAQAAGPGAETTATFLLVGFGAAVAAGAGTMVWRSRRAPGGDVAPGAGPGRSEVAPAPGTHRATTRHPVTPCPEQPGPIAIPAPRAAADDAPVAPRS